MPVSSSIGVVTLQRRCAPRNNSSTFQPQASPHFVPTTVCSHENFRYHACTGRELPGEGELGCRGTDPRVCAPVLQGSVLRRIQYIWSSALPVAEAAWRAADAKPRAS